MDNLVRAAEEVIKARKDFFNSYIHLIESIFIDNQAINSITLGILGYGFDEEYGLSLKKINETFISERLGEYKEEDVLNQEQLQSMLIELNLKMEHFLLIQNRLTTMYKPLVLFFINKKLNLAQKRECVIYRNQLNTLKTYFSEVKDSDVKFI